MRVLYANPIFLNYRIPFYKELNRLFNGNFYVLYSKKRYIGRKTFEPLLEIINKELGEYAISYNKEITYYPNTNSFHFIPKDKINSKLPFVITFPLGLLKTIKKYNPDVLITEGFSQWTPFLCFYSWIHKIPIFIGYERTCYTERNASKIKLLERKVIDKFASGYIANGSETKKYLESLGFSKNKIFIGGMSADSSGLRETINKMTINEKEQMKNKFNPTGHGLIYLYSGRFDTLKGVKLLLEAWKFHLKKHKEDTLILIGNGPLFDEMYGKYKNEKSIYFEGFIPFYEVGKYYAISDVFILPTLQDNWSLVIPEAMACGLPVASSIYNGCYPELVIKDRNGITFDPLKQETIISTLDYFHKVDLKRFGNESIIIEKEFNTENSAMRAYKGILNIVKER